MNTYQYHLHLAEMQKIRTTQMNNEIIPFYEEAGLKIDLLKIDLWALIIEIDYVEQYIIHKSSIKLDNTFVNIPALLLYFVEPEVYKISRLTGSDKFIAPMHVYNKKTIHTIPTEMIKIQSVTKTEYFISPDVRVNVLKEALPHIILSGE